MLHDFVDNLYAFLPEFLNFYLQFPRSVLVSLPSFKILARVSCISCTKVVRERSEYLILYTSFVSMAAESAEILVNLGVLAFTLTESFL